MRSVSTNVDELKTSGNPNVTNASRFFRIVSECLWCMFSEGFRVFVKWTASGRWSCGAARDGSSFTLVQIACLQDRRRR